MTDYLIIIEYLGRQDDKKFPKMLPNNKYSRDRPRFFDQVGHQTTKASIGNKHFFTK